MNRQIAFAQWREARSQYGESSRQAVSECAEKTTPVFSRRGGLTGKPFGLAARDTAFIGKDWPSDGGVGHVVPAAGR